MALLTDGNPNDTEALRVFETAILDVAKVETIDLDAKLGLATEEISQDVLDVLLDHTRAQYSLTQLPLGGERRRMGVADVVVTPQMKRWQALHTLAVVYRDAYNNQLNDRYRNKWEEYRELARGARERTLAFGIGLVATPVPRPGTPVLGTAAGALAQTTYYVQVSWVSAAGQEGSVSAMTTFETTDNSVLTVAAVNPPGVAAGWNVYLGLTVSTVTLQNSAPWESARPYSCLMQDEPERGAGFSHKMSLKGGIGMLGIDHQHGRFRSGEPGADPGVFGGEREVRFAGLRRAEVYAWVERTLVRHEYASLGRAGKGLVRQYVGADDGVEPGASDAADRGASQDGPGEGGRVSAHEVRHTLHGGRRGLAGLRGQGAWESERSGDQADSGARVHRLWPGGVRAAGGDFGGADLPIPQLGRLSQAQHQLSADAAHGDSDWRTAQAAAAGACPDTCASTRCIKAIGTACKGIYHINAVDEVTQWEIVAATPQISELWLIPLLETMLAQFPFVIRGFHSDNGSEFINYTVAKLLGKLLIEQTKSRAHHSGDNGLVEAKNGAVIRKHLGFGHIGAQHAAAVDTFHREQLNPYVNFHRPCAVPSIVTAANGKRRRVYLRWATPFELFQESTALPEFAAARVTLAELEVSPSINPTPKPRSTCNAPNANC